MTDSSDSSNAQSDKAAGDTQVEFTLMDHLIELRDRLLHMVLAILIVFIALFSFSNKIFTLAATPLLKLMPAGTSMIATGVTAPFLVPFKLVLMLSVLLTIPYLLHQIWSFIAPGLYRHEKRLAAPLLISSVVLFYCGIAFAYFVIFPIMFGFFIGSAPKGVAVMTDIGQYLDFIIAIFLAFGIAFEVPIATFLLVLAGITTPQKLADKRPYIIIASFAVGMVLTPPDVISQSMLAIPIWLLFELGLLASRLFLKNKQGSENTIMATDEFELIEEAPTPTSTSEAQSNKSDANEENSDVQEESNQEDHATTDDEMEKLFDEAEQEEDDNNENDNNRKS